MGEVMKFLVEIETDKNFTADDLRSVLHDGFTEGYGYNVNNWGVSYKVVGVE
jgi:hypothetical protein